MSEKMKCPGCDGYSSSVLADYQDGIPCRFCGLPHEAAVAIVAARQRFADAGLTAQYEEAIKRATIAERDAGNARRLVSELRELIGRFDRAEE